MRYTECEYDTLLLEVNGILRQFSSSEKIGTGISSYIYAKTGGRAIELSWDQDGLWVEYFVNDNNEAHHEETHTDMNTAIESVKEWFS